MARIVYTISWSSKSFTNTNTDNYSLVGWEVGNGGQSLNEYSKNISIFKKW